MMLYHRLKTTFPDVYTSRTMIAAPSVVRLILKYRPPGLYFFQYLRAFLNFISSETVEPGFVCAVLSALMHQS